MEVGTSSGNITAGPYILTSGCHFRSLSAPPQVRVSQCYCQWSWTDLSAQPVVKVCEASHWNSLAVIVCNFAAFQTIHAEILKTSLCFRQKRVLFNLHGQFLQSMINLNFQEEGGGGQINCFTSKLKKLLWTFRELIQSPRLEALACSVFSLV